MDFTDEWTYHLPREIAPQPIHSRILTRPGLSFPWPLEMEVIFGRKNARQDANSNVFLENCQKLAYRRAFLKISPEFLGENRHGRRRSPKHLARNLEFTSTFLCGKLHFYSFFIHFLFISFHILSHFCSEPRRNSLRRNEHLKNEPNVGTARVYILQTTHRDRHGSMTPARDSEKFLARISYVSFFVWYILYSIL